MWFQFRPSGAHLKYNGDPSNLHIKRKTPFRLSHDTSRGICKGKETGLCDVDGLAGTGVVSIAVTFSDFGIRFVSFVIKLPFCIGVVSK